MLRLVLAAALLLQCIPAPAWAALAEEAPAGVPAAAPSAALPSLDLSSLSPLSAPAPTTLPEAPQAVAALSALPALPPSAAIAAASPAAAPALQAHRAAQEPRAAAAGARASLTRAARLAARAVKPSASAAQARAAADFVDGARPGSPNEPVAAGSPSLDAGEPAPAPLLASPARGGGADAPAAPPAPSRSGVRAYLSGVFGGQLANNALIVTLPITLLSLGQSLASVGFVTSAITAFDMTGTLAGGWLSNRLSPASVLTGATAARALALAGIPVLAAAGLLSAPTAIALFMADAFARGMTDTSRNTVPLSLVGKDKDALDGLNSKYQSAFELGSASGPLLTGLLLVKQHAAAAHWAVAAAFAAAAAAFSFVPRRKADAARPAPASGASAAPPAKPSAVRAMLSDRWLRLGLGTMVALSLTPALKALVPALFAKSILHAPALSAWLVLGFGLGGALGSLLYNRLHERLGLRGWLGVGAAGAGVLALGLTTGGFWTLGAATLAFAAANVVARLALTSSIQARLPDGTEGGAMGVLRFGANLASMGIRLGVGLAFAAAASPAHAFAFLAAGLGAAGLLQLLAARKLGAAATAAFLSLAPVRKTPQNNLSPVHGLPGRLIVVEGLDGSGKSTQLDLIKQDLESRGLDVVVTTWNSSDLVSEAVKKAKREQRLTPKTFALLNAADFADRVQAEILPALRAGKVVLADRWFYTALARDSVRGNDSKWLRSLYAKSLKPDLALYFKLPVATAVGRVLSRSGKPSLSEDYEDDERPKAAGPKHYEAGLDLHLSDDPVENFKLFQTRVTAAYDAQEKEFGLRPIDASKTPDQVRAAVAPLVAGLLGDLSRYKRAEVPEGSGLFDKDPAGDAENIRRNYAHAKKGAHFYFRNMLLPMQERFTQLLDVEDMPRVLLHGSPHVDNYSRGLDGAAMVDFDRSRVGPYAWDLSRALVSVSLRRKKQNAELMDPEVSRQLLKGYLHGLRHPDKPFSEMRKLKGVEPKADEESVSAYLAAGKKWAKELRSAPLPPSDPAIRALMAGYRASQQVPSWLDGYKVVEAGRGQGSMGFRDIYLVVLAPKGRKSKKDDILLSFKQVRADPDTRWFTNPYKTQSERMIAASQLYAPGFERYEGWAMLGGKEFNARAVPPFNAKLKKLLDADDQADFLYAVGTQLGRAHALSYRAAGGNVEELEKLAREQYPKVLLASLTIRDELLAAYQRYMKRMRDEGLAPKDDGQADE